MTKLTEKGEERALGIKEAVIYTPTVICQNHIDIIDTPGLNDNQRMTRVTIGLLEEVDCVIVLLSARAPLSETERLFIGQLIKSEQINQLLFVISFMDQLDEDDYEYDSYISGLKERIYEEVIKELVKKNEESKVIQKAHHLLKNVSVYGMSAAKALEYFITNDVTTLRNSRFEAFKTGLMSQITGGHVDHAIRETLQVIEKMTQEIETQYLLGVDRLCQAYSQVSVIELELERGMEVGSKVHRFIR